MAFCDSSVKVISALFLCIFDLSDMADAKEVTMINNKQIELALIIRKASVSGEEHRSY